MWGGMMRPSLETTPKNITVTGNFAFITLGMLNRPDLHFEGAGNGPVVITRIGRWHELHSGASPISLVENYVTSRHDRRLLSLLGFVHNWPTSRWSATKKENWFSWNGNGIMSFLEGQFYRSTLYVWQCSFKFTGNFFFLIVFVCVYVYTCLWRFVHTHTHTYIYIYIYIGVCVRVCVFIAWCVRQRTYLAQSLVNGYSLIFWLTRVCSLNGL